MGVWENREKLNYFLGWIKPDFESCFAALDMILFTEFSYVESNSTTTKISEG